MASSNHDRKFNGIVTGREWLDELAVRVTEQAEEVEALRVDSRTLSLALGSRGVTVHDSGDAMWLAPSFISGGALGRRDHDRVQHLEIQQYGINDQTVEVAVGAVLGHLRH